MSVRCRDAEVSSTWHLSAVMCSPVDADWSSVEWLGLSAGANNNAPPGQMGSL